MNDENLIDGRHRSQSESRENGRKGGIASGKARRIKSHGRKLVIDLLNGREPHAAVIAELEKEGINPKDLTREVAMHLRQIDKAILKADTKAYNAVLRASGLFDDEDNSGQTVIIQIGDEAARSAAKWSSKKAPKEDTL